MATVHRWTGHEAKLLRQALRLSIRDFAAHLGIGVRTINKWEARQSDITPLPHMQQVLDTALARASDEAQALFAAAARVNVPTGEAARQSVPAVQDVTLLAVVNGRLMFIPVDAGALAAGGLDALLNESTIGSAGASALASPENEGARTRAKATAVSADLWQTVTAISLGVGQANLDPERLDWLIPHLDADELPRQLGAADVDAIEGITDALRRCDFARGGGLARAATIGHLRAVLRLRAAASSAIRVRLDIAAADLAMLTAWCSYDVEQHDQARRLWTVALELCRNTDHPGAADLAVDVLLDMAHQSLHLGRPEEALRLTGFGLAVDNNSPSPISNATRSYLSNVQSWSYALLGDATACGRTLGEAERHFAAVDQSTGLPWSAHVNSAEFVAQQGHAWYLLSAAQPELAARAVPLLTASTRAQGNDYARTRAINLAGLAGSHARAGDIDAAVNVGRHALEEITRSSSRRAYQRLRMLDDCLAVHPTADVADLRHDIQTACVVS